jgi:hypothetical protein
MEVIDDCFVLFGGILSFLDNTGPKRKKKMDVGTKLLKVLYAQLSL